MALPLVALTSTGISSEAVRTKKSSSSVMVNICYCLNFPELPLKGNYEETKYKLYFADSGQKSRNSELQTDSSNSLKGVSVRI